MPTYQYRSEECRTITTGNRTIDDMRCDLSDRSRELAAFLRRKSPVMSFQLARRAESRSESAASGYQTIDGDTGAASLAELGPQRRRPDIEGRRCGESADRAAGDHAQPTAECSPTPRSCGVPG